MDQSSVTEYKGRTVQNLLQMRGVGRILQSFGGGGGQVSFIVTQPNSSSLLLPPPDPRHPGSPTSDLDTRFPREANIPEKVIFQIKNDR